MSVDKTQDIARFRCIDCGTTVNYVCKPTADGCPPNTHELHDQMRTAHQWAFNGFTFPPKAAAWCPECAPAARERILASLSESEPPQAEIGQLSAPEQGRLL